MLLSLFLTVIVDRNETKSNLSKKRIKKVKPYDYYNTSKKKK